MRHDPLLSRDEFRSKTLARLGGRCCAPDCQSPAVDAHHIVERRLWPDGGYYLSNGAPLCSEHHLRAETTEIAVEDLRAWCGITVFSLPPQFVVGEKIDKWGNVRLPNGSRSRGELFFEDSVQKALAKGGVTDLFTPLVKHPRTWHVPGSPGATKDDRLLDDMRAFEGRRVVVTEKLDGECNTLYRGHFHARSLDSKHHVSRDWLKAYWASVRWDIPEDWRVVGEGTFAVHSIRYHALPSWFMGFMLWDAQNRCLSWDETIEWFALIGSSAGTPITPVPVLYDGVFDMKMIETAWAALLENDRASASGTDRPVQEREGYVIRWADGFSYREFPQAVAKWVRPSHVTTSSHWMHGVIEANGLR